MTDFKSVIHSQNTKYKLQSCRGIFKRGVTFLIQMLVGGDNSPL